MSLFFFRVLVGAMVFGMYSVFGMVSHADLLGVLAFVYEM